MISAAQRQRRREKREQQRQKVQAIVDRLRAEGKTCGNCRHIGWAPFGLKGAICELESDGEGYVIAHRGGICARHSPAITGNARPALASAQDSKG